LTAGHRVAITLTENIFLLAFKPNCKLGIAVCVPRARAVEAVFVDVGVVIFVNVNQLISAKIEWDRESQTMNPLK
jgi:hypothetical protein